ncbi:UNVERIFIED_ORG: integrase [Burkholderia sp. CF145]
MEHVIRRGARYVYRRRVPAQLVERVGKREVTKALGTADPKEAARLAKRLDVKIDDEWAALLAGEVLDAITPAAQAKPHPFVTVQEYDHADAAEANFTEYTPAEAAAQTAKSAVHWMEARVSAMIESLRGTGIAPLAVPPITAEGTPAATIPSPSKTLRDALMLWADKRAPVPNSLAMATRTVDRFETLHGNLALTKLTRQHFTAFQQAQTGSASSIRVYLSILKALLGVALDEGWVSSNVAAGIKTEQTRHARLARLPFSPDELKAVLDHARTFPKTSARYWLPLLGAYTGARLEELGQLLTNDIREETYRDTDGTAHTVSVIYVTDEGDNQKIKNASSRRRVPVHSELVAAGFLEFVKSRKTERLFADLKMDKNGRFSSNFSGWFGTQLRTKLTITDDRKTFHSTRHNVKDALREAGVDEQVSDALMGHSTGTVSRSYGGAYYPLRPLVEAVSKLIYHL